VAVDSRNEEYIDMMTTNPFNPTRNTNNYFYLMEELSVGVDAIYLETILD